MSKMLASLDRLEELSVHSDRDNSSNGGSFSNSLSNSRSASQNDSSLYDNSATGSKGIGEGDVIAETAGKTVLYLKFFVLFVLLAATGIVGAAVYLTTSNGEDAAFEQSFDDSAAKVFDTFKINVEHKLATLDKFGVDVTSIAVDSGASWPNFTFPDFEYQASAAREHADMGSFMYLPLVNDAERLGWEAYSVQNAAWIQDSLEFQDSVSRRDLSSPSFENGFSDKIYVMDNGEPQADERSGPFYPIWQHYPVIPELVNFDLLWDENFHDDLQATIDTQDAVIGKIWDLSQEDDALTKMLAPWIGSSGLEPTDLVSKIFYPIFDGLGEGHHQVALVAALVSWKDFFRNILSLDDSGIIVVVSNECGQSSTYEIAGEEAFLMGEGDLHDRKYESFVRRRTFQSLFNDQEEGIRRYSHVNLAVDFCPYTLSVYPSDQLESAYVTNDPLHYILGVVAVFGVTIIAFLAYDYIVNKRQNQVMKRAVQSRAIVSSLFPAAVRDRLFRADDSTGSKQAKDKMFKPYQTKNRLKNFLSDSDPKDSNAVQDAKPIADLFPHTTVMFADIAGFTRWSSERDPTQVFTLLQTVYHSFDRIAKKRKVFKVETIGDCYVAVTGLPDPQVDHALRMCKFANECKVKFTEVVEMLKESLGDDTADLAMRFGLHSGPVTAGVLRGEKSRFQLFGNTVNTAAKMENTGQRNKIQISSETADLITAAGKGHWIFLRVDDIAERGGIQTYWVEPQSSAQEAKHKNSMQTRMGAKKSGPADDSDRLIDWNVDLLKNLLKRIVAYRNDMGVVKELDANVVEDSEGSIVRDEVAFSITFPKFDDSIVKTSPDSINLGREVEEQLHSFVSLIAGLYYNNPFHNFTHAANVCTNANKMMKSITDQDIYQRTRDPLTHFAVVFSALIHDVDHAGVPNITLMKEKPRLAALYKRKSCAEQNSVDLAWNLLMDPEFQKLQDTIFYTKEEFTRFRQIVVQIVMSTDIFDKELNADRDVRWRKAFGEKSDEEDALPAEELANLRATVSIECAMQLSDIMHTTQHFHSYCRWNERLFEEMYSAFDKGRSKKDPSTDWYQGELWFFDNCVIPMAERIRASAVFGAQGEDCLRNAVDNRKEWAIRGGELLASSIDKVLKNKLESEVLGTEQEQEEKTNETKEHVADDGEKKKSIEADKHMIEWNVDLFKRLLRQILAHRIGQGKTTEDDISEIVLVMKEGSTVRNELSRIIKFPFFDKEACRLKVDPETIELSDTVQTELRNFILFIAGMYKDHPFHNFKHASNVATTTNKYLQRIKDDTLEMQVFEPLTQFAIIFSALCHDVDHPGVPNSLLVAESDPLAEAYNYRSIAEQNSVDVAWNALMGSEYKFLQSAIFCSQDEMERFRKLVVNSVLATDLFDQDLIEDRLLRWKQAFNEQWRDESLSVEQQENLRATVVMEHILMASDIGHTIQHWHSYKRWNERLYFEMYEAFNDKRLEIDPTASWYSDEIKFFDTVVIPMANRLKDCEMFGMAGDDAIRCAQSNRKDWVVNGGAVVEGLKKRYKEYKAGNIR